MVWALLNDLKAVGRAGLAHIPLHDPQSCLGCPAPAPGLPPSGPLPPRTSLPAGQGHSDSPWTGSLTSSAPPGLSSPRPQGCQAPSVWEPSGIGRAPPKRPGVQVACLTAAVGGQACTWEGREEPAAATGDSGSDSPFLSPPCRLRLQTPEGQTKKPNAHSGWATGLPHSPPLPPHYQPSRPSQRDQ